MSDGFRYESPSIWALGSQGAPRIRSRLTKSRLPGFQHPDDDRLFQCGGIPADDEDLVTALGLKFPDGDLELGPYRETRATDSNFCRS